jgi:hypothetical protein
MLVRRRFSSSLRGKKYTTKEIYFTFKNQSLKKKKNLVSRG